MTIALAATAFLVCLFVASALLLFGRDRAAAALWKRRNPPQVRAAREVESLLGYLEAPDGYRPYVVRIHELENEGDTLWMRAMRELFRDETDHRQLLRWHQIYAALEAAIDRCESSARLIERAITRQLD